MACGCNNACGCEVIGDGVTASVVRLGDTFTVSAIGAINAVADTPCVALDIDDDKVLAATLVLENDGTSVELVCGPDGLSGSVVVDPSSTAIVSQGPDGLRVDIPPPAAGSIGPQPGDLIFFEGIGTRPGAIDADGEEVSRAGYPALHNALSLKATTAARIVGDDMITGIPSTRFMAPGMPLEATGFPFGMTVVAVVSSTIVQTSAPADTSGLDTEVRVYPHGNGDGIATFNTPNASRRYPLGYDYQVGDLELGELGGSATATLVPGNLPLHDHPASVVDPGHDHGVSIVDPGHDHGATGVDAGHTHPITGDGLHNHQPGTARDSRFVTVLDTVASPFTAADYVAVPTNTGLPATPTQSISIPTEPDADPGIIDYGQGNRSFTSNDGNHNHGGATNNGVASITVDVVPAGTNVTADVVPNVTGISVDVLDAGSATPAPIATDPAHIVGRWMVVV